MLLMVVVVEEAEGEVCEGDGVSVWWGRGGQ